MERRFDKYRKMLFLLKGVIGGLDVTDTRSI